MLVERSRESISDAATDTVWADIEAGSVVRIRRWWSEDRARAAASAVEAATDRWVPDFDGRQFAIGRAWYAHLETGRTRQYFAEVAQGDADVEATLPGVQDDLRVALQHLVGQPVRRRRGWGGAGVHVFPAGEQCARIGGCVHFDEEGLTPVQRAERPGALSMVLMLQPPVSGGALHLWNVRYGAPELAVGDPVVVRSEPGDLVVFDSLQLHQIQPFGGDRARISITQHGVATPTGWECWF